MPKIKTSKTVQKRIVKLTATGKLMRRRVSNQHLARRKSKRSRKLNLKDTSFHSAALKKLKRLVPYLRK